MYNAFRHSLGCHLLDMGYSLDHVKDQLGHTDIRTTLRYAERKKQNLTSALDKRRLYHLQAKVGLRNKTGKTGVT